MYYYRNYKFNFPQIQIQSLKATQVKQASRSSNLPSTAIMLSSKPLGKYTSLDDLAFAISSTTLFYKLILRTSNFAYI